MGAAGEAETKVGLPESEELPETKRKRKIPWTLPSFNPSPGLSLAQSS